MLILALDTCFNKSYLALCNDDKIIESKIIESTDSNYHSAFLISSIRDILKNNNLLVKNIDMIGVNIGPGSFTGIRAGITIARVLAQQFNIKIFPVTSLNILSCHNKTDKRTITVLDARKNKVYFAEFQGTKTITEPMLIMKDELIGKLNSNDYIISDLSVKNYLKENSINAYNYEDLEGNPALFIINIIKEKLNNSPDNDYHWAKVKPLYIQPPSITRPKELNNV